MLARLNAWYFLSRSNMYVHPEQDRLQLSSTPHQAVSSIERLTVSVAEFAPEFQPIVRTLTATYIPLLERADKLHPGHTFAWPKFDHMVEEAIDTVHIQGQLSNWEPRDIKLLFLARLLHDTGRTVALLCTTPATSQEFLTKYLPTDIDETERQSQLALFSKHQTAQQWHGTLSRYFVATEKILSGAGLSKEEKSDILTAIELHSVKELQRLSQRVTPRALTMAKMMMSRDKISIIEDPSYFTPAGAIKQYEMWGAIERNNSTLRKDEMPKYQEWLSSFLAVDTREVQPLVDYVNSGKEFKDFRELTAEEQNFERWFTEAPAPEALARFSSKQLFDKSDWFRTSSYANYMLAQAVFQFHLSRVDTMNYSSFHGAQLRQQFISNRMPADQKGNFLA